MNIVIEGCDGSGKSTLAQALCSQLGLYYWHESAPRSLEEYKQMLAPGGVVFDRFCFGQFVYNTPEQRKMTEEELSQLVNKVFKETHTLLIYVDCSTDTIIQRLIQRGEGSKEYRCDMEKWVKNIRGTYRSILRKSQAEYIEIDGGKGICFYPF